MNKVQGIAREDKVPVFFEYQDGKIVAYDGESYGILTQDELKDMRSLKTPFYPIPKSKREKGTLKEMHDKFIEEADELKRLTNNRINLYRTGKDSTTAIYLAYYFLNQKKFVPETISSREALWIQSASSGQIIFGREYKGKGYKLDFNSAYPSIYSHVNFLIPIKVGEFKQLTKKEFESMKFFPMGIYRAIVTNPDETIDDRKIFRMNKNQHYTQIDLMFAKKIGFHIEIIEDGNDNFLCYPRDKCVTGAECFGEYVRMLYPLRKNPKVKDRCKSLLRALWGALTQYDLQKMRIHVEQDYDVNENKEVIEMNVLSDTHYEIKYFKKDHPYTSNWARLKPFMLAKGRVKIADAILPIIDRVHYCHTDSMIIDVDPETLNIKTSMQLGDLKYEGHYDQLEIINARKLIGDFKKSI